MGDELGYVGFFFLISQVFGLGYAYLDCPIPPSTWREPYKNRSKGSCFLLIMNVLTSMILFVVWTLRHIAQLIQPLCQLLYIIKPPYTILAVTIRVRERDGKGVCNSIAMLDGHSPASGSGH